MMRKIIPLTLVLYTIVVARSPTDVAASFLLIWPNARSTALAGAVTSLTEQEVTYWNPAAINFTQGVALIVSGGEWLPGLWPGMCYSHAGVSFAKLTPLGKKYPLSVGLHTIYQNLGETDLINDTGLFLGRVTAWRGAMALSSGMQVGNYLSAGISAKLIYVPYQADWIWKSMPELGIDRDTGTSIAGDLGIIYHPKNFLSLGMSLANLGQKLRSNSTNNSAPLPSQLRLGLSLTSSDNPVWRIRLLMEIDKILVGMFSDTTRRVIEQVGKEIQGTWKSLGFEFTLWHIFSARFGYFEDIKGQRGGVIVEKDGQSYHYGLWDVLIQSNLGKFKSIGFCWGLGVGWKDYIRFDISSDAAIYDFTTSNIKIALSCNNVLGAVRELRRISPKIEYVPGPRDLVYTGSGVLLSKSGLFATCHHVIEEATQIEVYFPKRDTFYPAKVIVDDPTNDLAILRLSFQTAADSVDVPFALIEPEEIKLGMETFTIGFPLTQALGKEPRYSSGSVSALVGILDNPNYLQIQNPVQPGNSGGPLFSKDGHLLGIVVARLNAMRIFSLTSQLPENVNFAVKVNRLANLLVEIPDGKEVLQRTSQIKTDQNIVEQVLPFVGYVLVKVIK